MESGLTLQTGSGLRNLCHFFKFRTLPCASLDGQKIPQDRAGLSFEIRTLVDLVNIGLGNGGIQLKDRFFKKQFTTSGTA
jgi:hypothetical protein